MNKVKMHFLLVSAFILAAALSAVLFAGGDDENKGFRVRPALQVVNQNSVGIMWEVWNDSSATLKISTSSTMSGAATLTTSSKKLHRIRVNGLTINTRYYYTVTCNSETSAVKSFITALPKGSRLPFRFILYGDSRRAHWAEDIVAKYSDNDDHLPVCQSMMSYGPDFILHVGDFVYSGTDMDDIYNFFDVEKDLLASYPVIPTYGNHEFKGGSGAEDTYMDSYLIPAPGNNFAYYSMDYGNVHILVLNTGEGVYPDDNFDLLAPGSAQHQFTQSDLAAAAADPDIDHIFVALHVPLYSCANFGDNGKMQQYLEPLFIQYGVKAVFYGHEHDYQHLEKDGIHYLLSGGAGSSILDLAWKGDQDDTAATLIKYDDVLNYVIIDVNGSYLNFQVRQVQGQGNSSSSLMESFSL